LELVKKADKSDILPISRLLSSGRSSLALDIAGAGAIVLIVSLIVLVVAKRARRN
jgi:hypothetical protein